MIKYGPYPILVRMQIYLVGGAIRDILLGLPVKERDFLVVGGSEQKMLDDGFIQVGKDFPVFLHPKTKEEYALARTERKTGKGYLEFSCDTSSSVTLEEDLVRRDLTINAMALPLPLPLPLPVAQLTQLAQPTLNKDDIRNKVIDPYNGKRDIDDKVLRHVSVAFAEDPVRVLRVGRFLARYGHLGFRVADETIELMKTIVIQGEIDHLIAERVWKELERALTEKNPELFFEVLKACGAFSILFPTLYLSADESKGIQALISSVDIDLRATIRLASYLYVLGVKEIEEISERYRFPNNYRDLATLTAKYWEIALRVNRKTLEATTDLLKLYMGLNVVHQMERFRDFLVVVKCISVSRGDLFKPDWLLNGAIYFKEESAKVTQELLKKGLANREMGKELEKARIIIVDKYLRKFD